MIISSPSKITAGIVQFDVQKGQIEQNLAAIMDHLETLSEQKCDLAVLPEMFSCSFDNENLHRHARETGAVLKKLEQFALKHKMAVSGSLPVEKNGNIFNVMVFIDRDGQIKARYEKIHLFRLTGEHLYYTAGDTPMIVDTSIGRVGFMTCYDLRFPELARRLYLDGVKLIIVSAQWPSPRKEQWQALITARAIENQLFMICTNRTGKEDDLQFPGMSMIVGPAGESLVICDDSDQSAWAVLAFEKIDEIRKMIPCMSDRRKDVYG